MKERIITLTKVLDFINNKLNEISGICISIITVLVLAEIIARRFFNYGILFVLETNSYLLAISWFLSAPFTLRTDGHIRINILAAFIKNETINKYIDIFANLVGIVISYFFFIASFVLTKDSYLLKKTSHTALRAPLYIPQTFITIGLFFLLVQMIVRMLLVLVNEAPEIELKLKS